MKSSSAKWLFGLLVFILATFSIMWLAGFFFFLFSKANPLGQTGFTTWLTYWQYYQHDPAVSKRLTLSLVAAAVVCYGAPGLLLSVVLHGDERQLYGNARFANTTEIAKAGLFSPDGIIVGKWNNRFLLFPGAQFVLLAAPTRSGKGVGIVIPNLLNYAESLVVLDVKLENFLITSAFRAQHGQEVYLFNPFALSEDSDGNVLNGKTHRYNPLGYISDDPRLRVTDILNVGYAIYPDGGVGNEGFFQDAARNLFLGLALYLCETPELPRTIGELLRQSSGKGQPVKTHLQNIITERNYRESEDIDPDTGEITIKLVPMKIWDGAGLPPLSSECVDAINRFTSTSEATLTSIMATFTVPLTIFASPVVDAATSANDFDLRQIRKKRMSIYLGIPANKLAESRLLIHLFYTQLVNSNTNQMLGAVPELKHPCLILADEFTAPGRISAIEKTNAFMAGYGLRLLTVIQSLGQLEALPPEGYGREKARTLMTNHACQIFFTPRELRDANEYSEALGYTTVHSKNKSRGKSGSSLSESVGEGAGQRRALMLPQELKEMPQTAQIVSIENTKPIKCAKITYYNDPAFVSRLKSVSPTLAALGRKLPTQQQLESAWRSGELAAHVPLLDLDLHEAIVHARIRDMTLADVDKGIELDHLAVDTANLPIPVDDGTGLQPDQIEGFVNEFFDQLDAASNAASDIFVAADSDTPLDEDAEEDGDGDSLSQSTNAIDLSVLESEPSNFSYEGI